MIIISSPVCLHMLPLSHVNVEVWEEKTTHWCHWCKLKPLKVCVCVCVCVWAVKKSSWSVWLSHCLEVYEPVGGFVSCWAADWSLMTWHTHTHSFWWSALVNCIVCKSVVSSTSALSVIQLLKVRMCVSSWQHE